MLKDIGGLSGPLLIIQQAQPVCVGESIKQEHHTYGLGRYIMGTTKGNTTDDLQGSRMIDHQLRRTCLESKPTRHQLYRQIQYTQNEALSIATGCHKMSSIDHLHIEGEMLKVKEHSELLSAQYLARCLEPGNVCHPITQRATPEIQMKETPLYTRHRNTVEPMMVNKIIGKLHSKHSTLMQSIRLLSVTRGMCC